MPDALGFLIDPVARDIFFEHHYEQAPLHNARDEPGRYADMLSIDALDAFIEGADLRQGMLNLAHQGRIVDPASYLSLDGRVIASAVAEAYSRGATIILPHLNHSLPELGDFCRALEGIFSCHVQTNVYLTPAGEQGFSTHSDNHDVFILQVSGAKRWRFYDGAEEIFESFTLNPGDCVYVPRGLIHDAISAGADPSLHISVGLITRSWADLVLQAVTELASREPALRRSLPPGFANRNFDRAEAAQRFEELTALIRQKAQMDSAFDLLADNFLRERRPKLSGVIASPEVPTKGALYRRRKHVLWRLKRGPGGPVLIGPGGDLLFSHDDEDALQVALAGEPFAVPALPCKDPLRVFMKLWSNGYLERARGH